MEETMSERVVLITGASGSLGREIALHLAETEKAALILHGRDQNKLNELYDAVVACGAPEPMLLPADWRVCHEKEASDFAGAVSREWGHLDALIHTATPHPVLSPVESMSQQELGLHLQSQVVFPWLLTRALLFCLKEAENPRVIFTLDSYAIPPKAYFGAYAVAKAALTGLVDLLVEEWSGWEDFRVYGVIPGPMNSSVRKTTHPGENRAIHLDPKEAAKTYASLLDNSMESINSGVMTLDELRTNHYH
jgi:NAD(P)-dependent dehydrogenase (short-subunit alcohol dehydrogenase family)